MSARKASRAAKAQTHKQSSTLTQDQGMAYLFALRPVVQMMLSDIEKSIIACKRGELSLDKVQESLHYTAGIMGVSLADGSVLS